MAIVAMRQLGMIMGTTCCREATSRRDAGHERVKPAECFWHYRLPEADPEQFCLELRSGVLSRLKPFCPSQKAEA
jgi:hypothetical protein